MLLVNIITDMIVEQLFDDMYDAFELGNVEFKIMFILTKPVDKGLIQLLNNLIVGQALCNTV